MVSKKILMKAVAGVASIAALGISTFAVAGGEFVPAPVPTATCDYGNPNFYVGGRVGFGNNYWNNVDYSRLRYDNFGLASFITRSTKHTGFAGGVEIGYAFNKFIAVEAGFMGLPRARVTHERVGGANVLTNWRGNYTRSINNYAFDISGKISIEFPNAENIGLFAKAGVGFLQSRFRNRDDWNGWGWGAAGGNNWWNDDDNTRSNTNLTYGFGIFWNFTQNLTLDGRFQRWHGSPSLVGARRDEWNGNFAWNGWGWNRDRDGYQPYMDAYTIGLTYHIDGTGDLFNT